MGGGSGVIVLVTLWVGVLSWFCANEVDAASEVRIAIELSAEPLFTCPECRSELESQQDGVMDTLRRMYRSSGIKLVDRSTKLVNALFVEIDTSKYTLDSDNDEILKIQGVIEVYPSEDWETVDAAVPLSTNNDAHLTGSNIEQHGHTSSPLRQIGVDVTAQRFCATGKGVTVAILDSGIDYTHTSMGGPGTIPAYEQAYGVSYFDKKNQRRDGLFPTSRIVEGYDFLGDRLRDGDPGSFATPDDDPVDASGHGTAVAHAVRSVAPAAQLIAVKICTTTGNACPDFSYVKGLEYVLDPNNDGNIDDAVDIVNVSLGRRFASSYYSIIGKAVEKIFALGVLPVLAAGNSGNVPFILGGAPGTPNALTVGSTLVYGNAATEDGDDHHQPPTMAYFSSRGPAEANGVKPDVIAPGGPYALAAAGTGDDFRVFLGTSFSAPLVAGAAALVKQKCPNCSPFAVKTLLMNYANHAVRYGEGDTKLAPVTLQGSGEIQIHRSLAAEFWAYSEDDMNPSIGLGAVNAAEDMHFQRRIRIVKMNGTSDFSLSVSHTFRSNIHAKAVEISFSQETISLSGECSEDLYIDVHFRINAAHAPTNRMKSGGSEGINPDNLDFNEVDGWIELKKLSEDGTPNEDHSVGIPFHMILRKASKVIVETTTFNSATLDTKHLPANLTIGLKNHGSEIAQIDGYQLIYVSADEPESRYGASNPPADLRYVGYRTVKGGSSSECSLVVEFAIQTWEKQLTLSNTHFNLWIDTNLDNLPEYNIYNSAYRLGSMQSEIMRRDLMDGTNDCIGYTPDHTTNSAVTILRFCSSDVGMPESGGFLNVALSSYSFPQETISDEMNFRRMSIPEAGLSMGSYNVEPKALLNEVTVAGTGLTPDGHTPMGLLLVNNAFRSETSTGAAMTQFETSVIVDEITLLPEESTADVIKFPVANISLQESCSWEMVHLSCSSRRDLWEEVSFGTVSSTARTHYSVPGDTRDSSRGLAEKSCPEHSVPRPQPTLVRSVPSSPSSLLLILEEEDPLGLKTEHVAVGGNGRTPTYRNISEIPPLPIDEPTDERWTSQGAEHSTSFRGVAILLILIEACLAV